MRDRSKLTRKVHGRIIIRKIKVVAEGYAMILLSLHIARKG